MASQSRHAEQPPADGAHESLRPHQRKVATALLVVLQKGFKSSTDSLIAMKQIIMSNSPAASLFMELVTEDGKLPSLRQLDHSASLELRDWLNCTSELCEAARCQPLELFRRSAACSTHFTAIQDVDSGQAALRHKRLQAMKTSLTISSLARSGEPSRKEKREKIYEMVEKLASRGVPLEISNTLAVILDEALFLLEADQRQLKTAPLLAGSRSSFTTCVDHMLPGSPSLNMPGQTSYKPVHTCSPHPS